MTMPFVPSDPFPGTNLQLGSTGSDVLKMQRYLNGISQQYYAIPRLTEDGAFGYRTQQAVRIFQRLNSLTEDGIIGEITWNRIVSLYANIPDPGEETTPYPGRALILGSRGEAVRHIQRQLNRIREGHPSIPLLSEDGVFGESTRLSVMEFQRLFLLPAHGAVEEDTWNAIENAARNLPDEPLVPWDGTELSYGSIGERTGILQQYLNDVGEAYPSIPVLEVDGRFGTKTQNAVLMFQHLFELAVDGVVGEKTWNRLLQVKRYLMRS